MSTKRNSLLDTLYDNPLVNNLNLLGANLREEIPESPQNNRRKKTKRERRGSFYKRLEPYKEPEAAVQLTLREMAQIYRERYPDKWKKRMIEREEQRRISLGMVDPDPMIVAYVEAQMKRLAEKKLLEEKRKLLPRTVTIELKYCTEAKSQNTLSARRRSGTTPELALTIIKGKNLFNHMSENEEPCEKCCVKALMYPDGAEKNKSSYRFLTTNGTTSWDHTFTFPWFSPELTENKYIILTVSGTTRAGEKKFIGAAALASKDALIHISGTKHRKPLPAEVMILDEAVSSPNDPAFAQLKLYPKDWSGMKDMQVVEREPINTNRRGSVFTMLLNNEDEPGQMPSFIAKGNKQHASCDTNGTSGRTVHGYAEGHAVQSTVVLDDGTTSTKIVRAAVQVIETRERSSSTDTSGTTTASQHFEIAQWKPMSKEEEMRIAESHENDVLQRRNAIRKVDFKENTDDSKQKVKNEIKGANDEKQEQNGSEEKPKDEKQEKYAGKEETEDKAQNKSESKEETKSEKQEINGAKEEAKNKKQKEKIKKQNGKDKKLETKMTEKGSKDKKQKAKLKRQESKDKKLQAKEAGEQQKENKQKTKLIKKNSKDQKQNAKAKKKDSDEENVDPNKINKTETAA